MILNSKYIIRIWSVWLGREQPDHWRHRNNMPDTQLNHIQTHFGCRVWSIFLYMSAILLSRSCIRPHPRFHTYGTVYDRQCRNWPYIVRTSNPKKNRRLLRQKLRFSTLEICPWNIFAFSLPPSLSLSLWSLFFTYFIIYFSLSFIQHLSASVVEHFFDYCFFFSFLCVVSFSLGNVLILCFPHSSAWLYKERKKHTRTIKSAKIKQKYKELINCFTYKFTRYGVWMDLVAYGQPRRLCVPCVTANNSEAKTTANKNYWIQYESIFVFRI